jgi:hypothetical protein
MQKEAFNRNYRRLYGDDHHYLKQNFFKKNEEKRKAAKENDNEFKNHGKRQWE